MLLVGRCRPNGGDTLHVVPNHGHVWFGTPNDPEPLWVSEAMGDFLWPIGRLVWIFGMKTYYDLRAKDYDDSTYRRADLVDLAALCHALGALEPGRTLDIACGTGWLSQYLRGDLVGLDQSRRMLALFARRHRGTEIVRADVPPLPTLDGSFDRCFSAHFLGHLQAAERTLLLSQAKRVAPELVIVEQQRPAGHPIEGWEERPLGDVSHRVYKHYWTGAELAAEIGGSVLLENDSYIAARWQQTSTAWAESNLM